MSVLEELRRLALELNDVLVQINVYVASGSRSDVRAIRGSTLLHTTPLVDVLSDRHVRVATISRSIDIGEVGSTALVMTF